MLWNKEGMEAILRDGVGGITTTINVINSPQIGACGWLLNFYKDNEHIANARLQELPHFCGGMFLSDLNVYVPRRRGVGTQILNLLKDAVRRGGYSQIQCIIPKDPRGSGPYWSKAESFFVKHGFKKAVASKVKNRRSNNICYSYFCNIGA